jgi:hypothetical protein
MKNDAFFIERSATHKTILAKEFKPQRKKSNRSFLCVANWYG